MHWMKSETTLIQVVNGNARSFAFSTSYFLKICSEIALHLDHSRAAGNDKRYPCVGWKSLMFITFSTIWEQIVVMNLRRRTFVNWITDMTILWGKKRREFIRNVLFFSPGFELLSCECESILNYLFSPHTYWQTH